MPLSKDKHFKLGHYRTRAAPTTNTSPARLTTEWMGLQRLLLRLWLCRFSGSALEKNIGAIRPDYEVPSRAEWNRENFSGNTTLNRYPTVKVAKVPITTYQVHATLGQST